MRQTYDAIVIGAGVLGASVAAHLAQAGYSVLILERNEAVCGASGGNLGQISIMDRGETWHMPLALRSQDYYREELSQRYAIEYIPSGGSITLQGDAQLKAGQAVLARMAQWKVAAQLYTGREIRQIEPGIAPDVLDGLLFCPAEGKLNPLLTTLAFLSLAKEHGAQLLEHTPVIGFEQHGGRITAVQCGTQCFSAQWIINCTGPRAPFVGALAGASLPVCYHKGTAFVSEPVAPLIRGPIVGGGFLLPPPVIRPDRSIGFGCVQTADGSILIAQSTENCPSDDKSVNMPSLQLVARRFLQYYPQLNRLRIVRAWAAVTTYTRDGLPVFGFSPEAENLFTAAGFKGAFTTAPAVGEAVTAALEGRMDPALRCCAPNRATELQDGEQNEN